VLPKISHHLLTLTPSPIHLTFFLQINTNKNIFEKKKNQSVSPYNPIECLENIFMSTARKKVYPLLLTL